jgi:Beta-propeller repeat
MNNSKSILCLLIAFLGFYTEGSFAQVAINTNGAPASTNTMLDLNPAIGKAFVPPKMTYAQIKAISPATAGMIVFDTDAKTVRMYDGTRWASLMPQAADNTTAKAESGSIFVTGISTDAASNVYITGYINGTANFGVYGTLTVSGPSDIFIAKYNSSLALQWVKQIGGSSDDLANGIVADAAGNFYITGINVTSGGGTTIFFVKKFDTEGTIIWTKNLSGVTSSGGQCIALDALGFVYVGGSFSGTMTFAATSITSPSSGGTFIAKYSIGGTEQWAKTSATSGGSFNGIATDPAGNAYVTGGFYSTLTLGAFSVTSLGSKDAFVAKYSAAGSEAWLKRAGGATHDEEGKAIAVDGSGNAYVTGIFNTIITFGGLPMLTSAGFADIFIAKYNTTGTEQWAQKAGSIYTDEANGITLDASGNVYIEGYITGTATFGTSPTIITTIANDDAFTAKYDSNGIIQWVQKGGGASHDVGRAIALDDTNRIYTVGTFSPPAQFGNQILTTGSLFLTKYSE